MFGASAAGQPQASKPSPFSFNFGTTTTPSNQPSIFAPKQTNIPTFNFGSAQQPQQQQAGLTGSIFGAPQQPQQPSSSVFGQPQPQQQPPQRPLDQTLRFGQSQQGFAQSQNAAQSLWEEGRGLGVYRSVPAQMNIVKDKWDPGSLSSPLRTYLYQHVSDESEALKYRPGPEEDENKWEEAVSKRPGPTWVPLLVRGFWELGKKAQIQMEAIQRCNMMLQEINTSLDVQLDTHRQKVATRLEECKRRQAAASQRTLALAVKVQILRNRGYVMDDAEEEFKARLDALERDVLDPSLNAREQEIWAHMLGIRERANRLKVEMDKIAPAAEDSDSTLDEETIKAAKKTLEAYDTQLRHLQEELQHVQQEFDDWEKITNARDQEAPRRR